MKNLKTPFAGLAILCTVLSCQKNVQQLNFTENPPVAIAASTQNLNLIESDWNKNLSWTKVELPSHTVFYTNIKTNISAETETQGLIRVFKSSNSSTSQSLPFEEAIEGQKYYWYYQVTEDNVMISVDVYGSKDNPATESSFKSVVLSKEAVANLEAKGNTKSRLMTIPLETLTSN
ncbi:MAG: hypothetical protein J7497_08335 [Chitinophagaceae bacterium]|nr:hypothetical protein [Chitinophagaceae bacterium]